MGKIFFFKKKSKLHVMLRIATIDIQAEQVKYSWVLYNIVNLTGCNFAAFLYNQAITTK